MKDIEDHVVTTVAIHWRQLGSHLNIDENSLDVLQHKYYRNDCEECCSRMLEAEYTREYNTGNPYQCCRSTTDRYS